MDYIRQGVCVKGGGGGGWSIMNGRNVDYGIKEFYYARQWIHILFPSHS